MNSQVNFIRELLLFCFSKAHSLDGPFKAATLDLCASNSNQTVFLVMDLNLLHMSDFIFLLGTRMA